MGLIANMWEEFCENMADIIRTPTVDIITSMLADYSTKIGELSSLVSLTPKEYNGGTMFSLVEKVQEEAVLPVAVIILTLVMCHELIYMIIDKNNMADCTLADMLKWIFKTTIAILFLDKSFEFVCAVFELAKYTVTSAHISSTEAIDFSFESVITDTTKKLKDSTDWWEMLGNYFAVWIIRLIMLASTFVIHFTVILRMIEIHLMISLAPIPFATLGNKEFSQIGQNYIKSIFALAFQSFFMYLLLAIFGILLTEVGNISGDVTTQLAWVAGYAVFIAFTFGKVGGYSNRVFGTQ